MYSQRKIAEGQSGFLWHLGVCGDGHQGGFGCLGTSGLGWWVMGWVMDFFHPKKKSKLTETTHVTMRVYMVKFGLSNLNNLPKSPCKVGAFWTIEDEPGIHSESPWNCLIFKRMLSVFGSFVAMDHGWGVLLTDIFLFAPIDRSTFFCISHVLEDFYHQCMHNLRLKLWNTIHLGYSPENSCISPENLKWIWRCLPYWKLLPF